MSHAHPQSAPRPIAGLHDGAVRGDTAGTIPLVSTRFTIRILGLYAEVEAVRVLCNGEDETIEAVLTFPVPVHAALFHLSARVGDRTLLARAQPKEAARQSYEAAIDENRLGVLHEEALRGVHVLRVGPLPPGAEVTVVSRFSVLAVATGGRARLRLPMTVGDIYGVSPIATHDDLLATGARREAEVDFVDLQGLVRLNGRLWQGEAIRVGMDAPLDVETELLLPTSLRGTAADGAQVVLKAERAPIEAGRLDVAVLLDRSGSMSEAAAPGEGAKHDLAVNALMQAAEALGPGDSVELFEFADDCRRLGPLDPADPSALLRTCSGPSGGTEIGEALRSVMATAQARTILLLTDGKSHALDVQSLLQSGRRVLAVLVGEDSFEARIGTLAVLSGGDVFAVPGAWVARAVRSAMSVARGPFLSGGSRRTGVVVSRGDALLSFAWGSPEAASGLPPAAWSGLPALATMQLLPRLPQTEAMALAVAEGLACHLTSLVLSDPMTQDGGRLPSLRRVPLPAPRTFMAPAPVAPGSARSNVMECPAFAAAAEAAAVLSSSVPRARPGRPTAVGAAMASGVRPSRLSPGRSGIEVPWWLCPDRLAAGDISALPADVRAKLEAMSRTPEVVGEATAAGLAPLLYLILSLAARDAVRDVHAARVLRRSGRTVGGAIVRWVSTRILGA